MPSQLTYYRVFIASPGGLEDLRKAFRDEIREFNETLAIPRGVYFQAAGWEETPGGAGRPQKLINKKLRKSDYFFLLLESRWGNPTDTKPARYSSGTEEEFHVAVECYEDEQSPMRQLVLTFKSVNQKSMSDPGPQLQKVLKFRAKIELEKQHLFETFDTEEEFCKLLRRQLATWLHDHEQGDASEKVDSATVQKEIGRLFRPSDQEPPEPSTDSAINKAWKLADAGRLTKAEVEFAKLTVERRQPSGLIEYGLFLRRVGRLDQATVMLNEAVKLATTQDSQENVSRAYTILGIVLNTRGELNGAEEMYRKALVIEEKLEHLEGMGINYTNLGIVLRNRGNLDGAEEMHRQSLDIHEKLEHLEGMASNYTNLGIVFKARGDLDGAEEMYRKALDYAEKLGAAPLIEKVKSNLDGLQKPPVPKKKAAKKKKAGGARKSAKKRASKKGGKKKAVKKKAAKKKKS
jgi:tetratricopeptide (TPR) repeat protein